jgi:hypothetical protein
VGVVQYTGIIDTLKADLLHQTSRADGATIAMQELQAENDGLKPWAELWKLIIKACEERFNKENKCWNLDSLNEIYKLFCQLRKELEGAE